MKRRALLTGGLMLLLGVAAFAADISGKWTAEVPGRNGNQTVTFTFKVDGANLTGSMSRMQGDTPIADGKIDGNNVEFSVTMAGRGGGGGGGAAPGGGGGGRGGAGKTMYKGVVSGSEIKFTSTREGGQQPPQEFVAKKATT